ncbi:hypothetical protein [Lysobacter brunescens]|uniref:Superinfection immunity protein n=1 Tax=Lysobacter brunescens TaxID=262323 RepID=A0ABW2Y9Z7_9GAMM
MGDLFVITWLLLFILFPICLVLFNKDYSGKAKLVGVLASLFFSWIGFIVFFLLMLAKKRAT